MKKFLKIGFIGLLVGALALVRMFEYRFFYDPFMYFFEQAYQDAGEIEYASELFFNIFLRYIVNTVISLVILYIAFKKWSIVKFSAVIYAVFFICMFPLFIYLMYRVSPGDYIAAFYVRRFLAHPLLILILLPAFLYQRLLKGE